MYLFIYFTSLHVSSNLVLIIRRIELYQYVICHISLCAGDCLVSRSLRTGLPDSHLHRVIYTRLCIDTIASPVDEHWVPRNMYRSEMNKYTEKSASSWLFTRIVPRCTVNEI